MSSGRAALVGELEAARAAHVPVRIRRAHGLDRLEGYAVAVGERWLLLARVADGLWWHGWTAVRLKDVRSVRRPDGAPFLERVLRLRAQWPPGAPDVGADLSSLRALLASLQGIAVPVAVVAERADPDVRRTGAVRRVGRRRVHLQEVTPTARWRRTTTTVELDGITRVDIGGAYDLALVAVAGPPPR